MRRFAQLVNWVSFIIQNFHFNTALWRVNSFHVAAAVYSKLTTVLKVCQISVISKTDFQTVSFC
jgi:hypothetical protein